MKKLLAVLSVMTLLLCSLGAATGDKVLVKIKIAITEPILTLEGSVDGEPMRLQMSHSVLCQALLSPNYLGLRTASTTGTRALQFQFLQELLPVLQQSTTLNPVDSTPVTDDATKSFNSATGEAGYFAHFTISFENLSSLAQGDYSSTDTVTYEPS